VSQYTKQQTRVHIFARYRLIFNILSGASMLSGTTVRTVVLGRFGQKNEKKDLKDTAKKE